MLLNVQGITVNYGSISALRDVSLWADQGELVSVIGANGAGKTTLLKTVSGILRPAKGNIEFDGRDITRLRPEKIVKSGVVMVPEGRRIFPDLTVKENLELGAYTIKDRHLKKTLFELVITTFPRLKERLKQHGGTLSGGEQQMLAMGRALMGDPRLLLLDEPSMGLSPIITREIFGLIELIRREKSISIILVEQNAHMALEHSQRAYVLENGEIVMEGPSSEIKHNPRIIDAYLGV
ncbi:MAG TPA: ABC transporter ATP-binding protein [Syntrophorhabdaceae bacterium]|nr:ABC transporter ATP-binding protein [Syntrophorhabdaceae bacterium]HOL05266.1 ABC transporter ATP-binding protein [Syntrophorhabdaceae bacterium]HON84923.1 ABC transporter ATP-binding protein [Syntrophorhabdaceae bacterium]HOT42209.1 ABC transporter ATP-binding protein [Syntrophorhabdaceae bacterium]HPC66008.1 ABC transporter ATP-binding protein [Syntrophorhabdaceae bacterium]